MVKLEVSNKLFERFPEFQLGVLKVENIDNTHENKDVTKKLKTVQETIRETVSKDSYANEESIKSWRKAYSWFGGKPKKNKASVEALLKRVLNGEDLPQLTALVDTYNYISLKYQLPLGADDIDNITQNIQLTFANGNEQFTAIGSDETKSPNKGEVIYKMGETVLCRRWNWREGDQTKITAGTKNALVYVETLLENKESFNNAIKELAQLLGAKQVAIINKDNNALDVKTMQTEKTNFSDFIAVEGASSQGNAKDNSQSKKQKSAGVKPPFPLYHWADVTAHKVICEKGDKESYTIAAGITPSGVVHIGNFREIMTNELVKRALEFRGKKVRFIYSWDDFDVFRKVPKNMPKQDELQDELRKPIVEVFDPHGVEESYARANQVPVEEQVKLVGISTEFIYQNKEYRKGVYAKGIKHALQNVDKIKAILNVHRKEPLADDWLPVGVFSKKFGTDNIKNVRYDGDWTVTYELEDGSTESQNFKEGGDVKLKWRVDWPMRWDFEQVDFEPGGKDHSTKGGSYDTGKEIVKQLWNRDAPTYIMYDFINVKGQEGKMSSSKGDVITLMDVLKIYEPEITRFLFAGTRANTEFAISFDVDVIKVYEDFDKCERIYFGVEKAKNDKEEAKQKRIYELSAVDKVPKSMPYQPSFRHLTMLLQMHEMDIDKTINYLEHELKNDSDKQRLRTRANCAKNWLAMYAPEDFKFTVQDVPQVNLAQEQVDLLHTLADKLLERNWTDKELHEEIYILCTNAKVPHKDFFKAAYNALINKDKGPKLAAFILEIGKDRVAKIFKSVKAN